MDTGVCSESLRFLELRRLGSSQRGAIERYPSLLLTFAEHVEKLFLVIYPYILNVQPAQFSVSNSGIQEEDGDLPFPANLVPASGAATSRSDAHFDGFEPLTGLLPAERRTFLVGGEPRPRDQLDGVLG